MCTPSITRAADAVSVQSIERAFTLLRTIAAYPDGISVTELSRRTALHKSTVSRLVISLETERAIQRDEGRIFIGAGIGELFASAVPPTTLAALIHPHLRRLSERFDETAGLAVPNGDCALYIDQVDTGRFIQISNWTGRRFPLHAVSAGKVFLAYASEDFVSDYLTRPLARFTPHTQVDPVALRSHLGKIRQTGFDWSFEEFTEGLAVVSAPVFAQQDVPIASIYLCGPRFRFPPEGQNDDISGTLVETCRRISHALLNGAHNAIVAETTAGADPARTTVFTGSSESRQRSLDSSDRG